MVIRRTFVGAYQGICIDHTPKDMAMLKNTNMHIYGILSIRLILLYAAHLCPNSALKFLYNHVITYRRLQLGAVRVYSEGNIQQRCPSFLTFIMLEVTWELGTALRQPRRTYHLGVSCFYVE